MANYGTRREVYVVPYSGSTLKYGFLTSVKALSSTVLGHIAVDRANLPPGLAFGVNAPKPGKASQKSVTGNESSFYDISQATALKAAGWRLSFPTIRRGKSSARSVCVYVTLGEIKYAWMQNKPTHDRLATDREGLGIKEGTANDRDLVWGARYPRPPRAYKPSASGINTISTFVDPSKVDSLPEGWLTSTKEFITGEPTVDAG